MTILGILFDIHSCTTNILINANRYIYPENVASIFKNAYYHRIVQLFFFVSFLQRPTDRFFTNDMYNYACEHARFIFSSSNSLNGKKKKHKKQSKLFGRVRKNRLLLEETNE